MIKRKSLALLKYIEKYTRTDMVYLATGSFWLTLNQGVTIFFSLILAVALANLLPENVFGNYRYILSLATIIGSFSLTGLNLAIVRDVARGINGLLRVGFKTQLKWSFGTFIAATFVSGYYFFHENTSLALAILIMGIFLPIISGTHLYSAYWEGKRDYKRVGTYSIISTITYTVSLFITIHFTHYLPIIILVYFLSQAICSIAFYRRSLSHDIKTDEQTADTLTLGKHISFLNIFSAIAGQLDKLLVFHYLGAVSLAVYAISQIPVGYVRTLFKQAAQLSYPKYASQSIDTIRNTIGHKMLIFTIPIVIIIFLYILCAPFVFKVFFPKYEEAVIYSQIAMLSLLFFQKKLIAYAVLASASKKHIYSMSIWSSSFKIVLLFILLPLYGIWGAVLSELIAQAVGFGTSLFFLQKMKFEEKKVS